MNDDSVYNLLGMIQHLVGRYQCLEAHTLFISRTIHEAEGSMFLSNTDNHLSDHTLFLLFSSI